MACGDKVTRYECRWCDGGDPCVLEFNEPMPDDIIPVVCIWSEENEFIPGEWVRVD